MMYFIEQLWVKRHLIAQLAAKELKVRYSTVSLGFLWALLSPLLTVGVLFVVFSCFLHIEIPEAPFLLYLMSSIFTWKFFQDSVQGAVTSLVDNRALLRDSAFPHYLIPVAVVIVNAALFMPSLFLLLVLSAILSPGLPPAIVFLPLVFLLQLSSTIGLAVAISIVYVRWRDIKYVLEPLLFLLFYLTPVFYSFKLVADVGNKGLYAAFVANPLVGILTLYRITIINGYYRQITGYIGPFHLLAIPVIFSFLFLAVAAFMYKKNKSCINDLIGY